MKRAPASPKSRGLQPPIRRVLAVDAGSRCIRLLLLESHLGNLRVARQEAFDFQAEGLLSPEELKAHLQTILTQWGEPPLALVLSQDLAVSQMVDVPPVTDEEARQLIEKETLELGGVNESTMVYDFTRVPPLEVNRHSFWVTFCQEDEIQSRITQLGLDQQEFREITTGGNALLTAWQVVHPVKRDAVLVHAGAQNTTLVAIRDGVGVLATSFPMAGDFFARAIARLSNSTLQEAEVMQRSAHLLDGETMLPGFADIVDGWAAELKRQLSECSGKSFDLTDNLFATGGTLKQPGLGEYLARHAGLKFQPWPASADSSALQPKPGFEIALGTALQALDYGPQPASLLPVSRRAAWNQRLRRKQLAFANALLLTVCFLVLLLGIWQKIALIHRQQILTDKVQAGLRLARETSTLNREVLRSYDELRPLFERQQQTIDTLKSLALLQTARSNRTLWYVLVADQRSYFDVPPKPAPTNQPPDSPGADMLGPWNRTGIQTSPARPGLIAELCVPEDVDAARSTLSRVVNDLKQAPVFERVDLLSEDLRRNLADPAVLLPQRYFALVLDFKTTDFQAAPTRKSNPGSAGRIPSSP